MLATGRILEVLGGPRLVGGRVKGAGDLQERVREGLPYACLKAVAGRYHIGRDSLLAVLHLPLRTLARRKASRRLRADESDRLLRVSRIGALAETVLGGSERAGGWLNRANRALGGRAPLDLLDTDVGAVEVEAVLLRIAHGVYS